MGFIDKEMPRKLATASVSGIPILTKDTDMTLTNGGLTYGTTTTKFWTLASIEVADLTGGASANYLKPPRSRQRDHDGSRR